MDDLGDAINDGMFRGVTETQRVFDLMDANNNGTIEFNEFMAALIELQESGHAITIETLDADGDGVITDEERRMAADKKKCKECQGKGTVNLLKCSKCSGTGIAAPGFTLDEAQAMFDIIDVN